MTDLNTEKQGVKNHSRTPERLAMLAMLIRLRGDRRQASIHAAYSGEIRRGDRAHAESLLAHARYLREQANAAEKQAREILNWLEMSRRNDNAIAAKETDATAQYRAARALYFTSRRWVA